MPSETLDADLDPVLALEDALVHLVTADRLLRRIERPLCGGGLGALSARRAHRRALEALDRVERLRAALAAVVGSLMASSPRR